MSQEVLVVPVESELDALFGQYVAADQALGLVYGLAGPEGLVHARGYGRYDDDGTEPDLDTVFPIASMSKSFSACGALSRGIAACCRSAIRSQSTCLSSGSARGGSSPTACPPWECCSACRLD